MLLGFTANTQLSFIPNDEQNTILRFISNYMFNYLFYVIITSIVIYPQETKYTWCDILVGPNLFWNLQIINVRILSNFLFCQQQ